MRYCVSKNYKNKEIFENEIKLSSLKEALEEVKPFDEIYLEDDYYYGKFYIKTPNIKIIGKSSKSTIDYDAYHGLIIRDIDGGDGIKTYGTTGSSSVTALPSASNLYMENITIKNSYIRKKGDKDTQNVAYKTSALNGYYYNCTFIGTQDTLYIDESDNVFDSCYIEGDVDFIFGSGDAIIANSEIKLLKVLDSSAYLCAPDTYIDNKYGFVFYNCNVLSVPGNDKYLGRAWYPGGAIRPVKPRAMFINVNFPSDVKLSMITMHEGDPVNYQCFIKNVTQNGETISNYDDEGLDDFYLDYIEKNIKRA